MKYLAIATVAFTFGLGACDSGGGGSSPPGSIVAEWRLTPTDCGTERVATIKAYLMRGGQVLDPPVEATRACADASDEGTVELTDVKVGTYTVVVEGWTANEGPEFPDGRAIYEYIFDGVKVTSNNETRTGQETLKKKPARLRVKWKFEDGNMCGENGTSEVNVELFDGTTPIVNGQQRVPCTATIVDDTEGSPFDGKDGVLFDAVDAERNILILATGYNDAGDKVREGQTDPGSPLFLMAGVDETAEILLAPIQ